MTAILRLCVVPLIVLLPIAARAADPAAAAPAGPKGLVVENRRAEKTVVLSPAELEKLGRVEVQDGTEGRKYSGVPLAELLRVADVEWGGNCSPLLTAYVLVEGADGYCVLFSIPEIDPGQRRAMVILADRVNGQPLDAKTGPYQIIEQESKQHGRWVRQVKKISLDRAARQTPRTP